MIPTKIQEVPVVIPLNPELLQIVRLFLEKYELLAEEDRKLYRDLIVMIANPPMLVTTDAIKAEDLAKGVDWGGLRSNRHPNTGRSATGS